MTAPWRPRPTVFPGTSAHRLIRGVLRMDPGELHAARIDLHGTEAWSVSLIDTGDGDAAPWCPLADTTFHILWQANEGDVWIEANGERYPIAPGDTMSVPAGMPTRHAAGMLVVRIEATSPTLEHVLAPGHGVETFEGYNRRTDYQTPPAFALQRWKITQPLTLPAARSAVMIVDLAAPLAMAWHGGTDLIARGDCRVIRPETGPVTLLPDGLGYALVVS